MTVFEATSFRPLEPRSVSTVNPSRWLCSHDRGGRGVPSVAPVRYDGTVAGPSPSVSRAVVVTRRGGPDVLEVRGGPAPHPVLGQVRIRAEAMGVGYPDLLMREGTYPGGPNPPFVPGYDVVGVVDAVGPGVGDVHVGDRVAALTVFGSYRDHVCVLAETVVPVRASLDAAEAVCLVLNATTAYQLLTRAAAVQPGEWVLVHGAAGGVGSAAIELGVLAGARMLGSVRGGGGDLVRRLGGDPIDVLDEDLAAAVRQRTGDGVDVVLDGIGGVTSLRSYGLLARRGRLVLFGHHSTLVGGRRRVGRVATFYALSGLTVAAGLLPGRRRVRTYRIAVWRDRRPDWFRDDLRTLFRLLEQRLVHPVVADRIPLADARRAHERLAAGGVAGRLVLVP